MTAFPADWDIYEDKDFAVFSRVGHDPDHPLSANTLIRLGPDGRGLGIFRIVVFGGQPLDIAVPIRDIIHEPPQHLSDLVIHFAARVDKLGLLQNGTTSAWRDLLALLQASAVRVSSSDGTAADALQLIQYLNEHATSTEKSTVGASVRWAVAVDTSGEHYLGLQSLPTQARYLTKANLKQDNAVSVLLKSFPLAVDLFTGKNLGGPVPLLFADDRDRVNQIIHRHQIPLRDDIAAVNAALLHMEHLSLDEAHAYLQGRARAAKGIPAYPAQSEPPAKRPRTNQDRDRETGKIFPFNKFSLSIQV